MSNEYKLDVLKENKVYNDTILALWSGQAMYQDYLASAMLIIGYDLRQNFDEMFMMDIGQNSAGTNKVIQLHGRDKSLILWYTNGDVIPIVAKYEEGNLLFSIYNHENVYLKGYIDGLSTKDLYGANDEVFNKLLELVTSQDSPLLDKIGGGWAYTLRNANMLQDLIEIMDDPQNMTTDIAQSLTDIFELLKSKSNKEINLPSGAPEVIGFLNVKHRLPEMTYSVGSSKPYSQYKRLIAGSVNGENGRYADGTRIVLSKDLSEVRVYDNKGLYYPVPILGLVEDFDSLGIENTQNKFLKDMDSVIAIAERSNRLYTELGDLKGAEFTSAEVLGEEVELNFKKTNWTTNKVVEGTITFKPDLIDYTITFKTSVKGVSQKLKLSDKETLVLPSSPLEFTKTVQTEIGNVAQKFHVGLHYVEYAKLADILQTNGLLVDNIKGKGGV
jgi:hypothetical protein